MTLLNQTFGVTSIFYYFFLRFTFSLFVFLFNIPPCSANSSTISTPFNNPNRTNNPLTHHPVSSGTLASFDQQYRHIHG